MCLPVLHKSFCSRITLYQQTDLSFTPVDPFTHQFYSLTQQAKNAVGPHRDADGEGGLVLLCYTRHHVLLTGRDAAGILCMTFSYFLCVKKSIFTTAVSMSSHPEFSLIVIITCDAIELKSIFITGGLLKLACLLQH